MSAYLIFAVSLILLTEAVVPVSWLAAASAGPVTITALALWALPRRPGRTPEVATDPEADRQTA